MNSQKRADKLVLKIIYFTDLCTSIISSRKISNAHVKDKTFFFAMNIPS